MAGAPDAAGSDDVLSRADARLARHRGPGSARALPAAAALLTDALDTSSADIPTLTDIAFAPALQPVPAHVESAGAQAPGETVVVSEGQWANSPTPEPA